MPNGESPKEFEKLKAEIDELKEKLKESTENTLSLLKNLPHPLPPNWNEISGDLERQKTWTRQLVEDAFLSLNLVKIAKPLIVIYLVVGLAIWVGGAIYGGIQIKSVQDQSQTTLREIRQVESDVKNAESSLRTLLKEQTNSVQQASDEAIKKISDKSSETVAGIQSQERKAKEWLAVDSLPDLSKLKAEIETLNKEQGRLNLRTLASLVDFSMYIMFAAIGISILLSVVAMIRAQTAMTKIIAATQPINLGSIRSSKES